MTRHGPIASLVISFILAGCQGKESTEPSTGGPGDTVKVDDDAGDVGVEDGAPTESGLRDSTVDANPRDTNDTDGCVLGQMTCDGACIDPGTDWQNCGSCGHTCTKGPSAGVPYGSAGVCSMGSCQCPSCERGCSMCPTPSGEECSDQTSDPYNCSKCGIVCPIDTPCCVVGTCRANDGGILNPNICR